MGFRKDFLWGGATAANQCEGGYNEGGRGLANVDLAPVGEDRFAVIAGKKKMFDFDDAHCLHCLVLDVALDFGVVHCLRCLVLDVGVLGLNGLRSLSCSVYCFVSSLYFLFYSGNLGCSSSSFHGILVFRAG